MALSPGVGGATGQLLTVGEGEPPPAGADLQGLATLTPASMPLVPCTPGEGSHTTIKSPWPFTEEFRSGCTRWTPSRGETPVSPTFQGHAEQFVRSPRAVRGHRRTEPGSRKQQVAWDLPVTNVRKP